MKYRAGYADGEMEIFEAKNDNDAFAQAYRYEEDHDQMYELDEIEEDYNVIRGLQ